MVELSIDGQSVQAPEGTTIWEAARRVGIDIPVLCHHPNLDPVAVCRVCAVEVEGARVLAAACIRQVEPGMQVRTISDRVERSRRMLVELLMADHPTPCTRQQQLGTCELEGLANRYGLGQARFVRRTPTNGLDLSSPVIAVDHNACILCDRCIRACDDIQVNEVIGRASKGFLAKIGFDMDQPMGQSTCVSCGECMAYCPTGALTDKPLSRIMDFKTITPVDSVCPYCGVGCSITYHVKDKTIARVTGRDGPANHGRLCVKGRYGFDYANHPQRLTMPLIRKPGYPKRPDSYPTPIDCFREATWDEALELAARRFREIKGQHGPQALAGFGSAKCSNEDNYLFQKFIRAVFGTNNVDHCTRLCHASSVAALMETIGSGAVSNLFGEVLLADVAIVIGSNAPENHPVAATFMKQAAKKGTTLIVIDPRKTDLHRRARYSIQFKPGTDVALLNAMMHVIIAEGLANQTFIEDRTEGYEKLRETVAPYIPEVAEKITGVPADQIRAIARAYGKAQRAIIFWGMGISQHTTGTDNARCLISLALLTGNVGRPGTGLHPLRGQNNVQGASDVGLIPFVYTDYQPVGDATVRSTFERAWGVPLDPKPGLTVVEIMHEVLEGHIKGMMMMGENPFLSDPNVNVVKQCLAAMEFLVCQDIFLTETAEFADVILPGTAFPEKDGTYTNTDRYVQLARKAINPPGQARTDWEVIADLSARMGYPMAYRSVAEIWQEIAALSPSFAGITHARLAEGGLSWPVLTPDHPGSTVLFAETFPKGKGKFSPAEFAPAKELPDDEYPFVLNTGRYREHWHTGTMTRRSKALDALSPEPFADLHPDDVAMLGARDGEVVRVRSRRGEIVLKARASARMTRGCVFIPFHFKEAAANLLTTDALDPYGKIPEFKFCAVRVER
ncbi:MAG: formate dehydrogenase subunit alpha, partial [Nitrospinae bacterium]|nr:formate dehydrogenase subunit alpha [Nitrospinota bacterium]